jgi:tetratricopeptide (TPR) repeat protein
LAFSLWRFWQKRGHLTEARRRLDDIEARPWAKDDPAANAHLLEALGGIAYWQGDFDGAVRPYQDAVTLWRELGDRAEIANALYNLAFTYSIDSNVTPRSDGRDVESGRLLLEESLAIYREIGDRRGIGNALWALGSSAVFNGRMADGGPIFEEARAEFKAAGDRTMEAWALHMAGIVAVNLVDLPAAADHFEHALRHFVEAGDLSGQALVLDDYATLALAAGDKERGIRLWAAARRLEDTIGAGLVQAQINASGTAAWLEPQPADATA